MQISFNKKLLLPTIAFLMLLALSFIAYTNTTPKIIDLKTYQNFLKNDLFTRAKIKDFEVILYTDEDSYSIIKDGINLEELLTKVPVEAKQNSNYGSLIFIFLLFIFTIMIALIFGKRNHVRKKRERADSRGERESC
jgi:hypothetical protein